MMGRGANVNGGLRAEEIVHVPSEAVPVRVHDGLGIVNGYANEIAA
jgi:hypothetical protein